MAPRIVRSCVTPNVQAPAGFVVRAALRPRKSKTCDNRYITFVTMTCEFGGRVEFRDSVRESDECLGFLDRYKPAEFAKLVKVAANLDADRLIDATHADRRKTGRSNQFGDGPACFGIIGRIE